jgi:hypothetical protein
MQDLRRLIGHDLKEEFHLEDAITILEVSCNERWERVSQNIAEEM